MLLDGISSFEIFTVMVVTINTHAAFMDFFSKVFEEPWEILHALHLRNEETVLKSHMNKISKFEEEEMLVIMIK